jgi:uncharacterized protein
VSDAPDRPRRTVPLERVLADDVTSLDLAHEPVEGAVGGRPTAGARSLGTVGDVEVGVWELTEGTVHDTEVDEVFVVLSGHGTVRFEDGERLDLTPGIAVRLVAGERTTWTIDSTLRKIWVA